MNDKQPRVKRGSSNEKERERIAYVLLGDIAIISIKHNEDIDDYKRKALEVAKRHPRVKAVYGKLETTGVYRTPRLVLLYGEPINVTWFKENGILFRATVDKVYVNPRLSTEHLLVAQRVYNNTVLDMFSGIGGFTLNILTHGKPSLVVSNDINPYAIRDQLASLKRNRRKFKTVTIVLNIDSKLLPYLFKPVFDFIVMDLPHNAIEFLPEACNLIREGSKAYIYVYAVTAEGNEKQLAQIIIEKTREFGCTCNILEIREVLDYAPRKYVLRFTLKCSKA